MSATMLSFQEIIFATPAFDEAIKLRYDILREPLGLDFKVEDIELEYEQIHLGAYDASGRLMGCLTLLLEEEGIAKMRQVAVAEKYQGKGIGSQLVEFSEKVILEKGCKEMMMHARESAVPFYNRLGYEKYGRRFTEVGVPHYRMRKVW